MPLFSEVRLGTSEPDSHPVSVDGRFAVDLDGPTTGTDRKSVLVVGIANSEDARRNFDDTAECAGSRRFMVQPDCDLDLGRRNVVIVSESVEVDILRVMNLNNEVLRRLRDGSAGELQDVDTVAV
jgi:hypothetical protein